MLFSSMKKLVSLFVASCLVLSAAFAQYQAVREK